MSPHNPIEAGKRGQVTAEGFGDVTCAKGPCARGAESEVYSSSQWQAGVQMTNPRSGLAGNGARRSNPFLCPTSTPQGQTQQPRWVRPWWVPPAQVLVAVLGRPTSGTAMSPPGWSIPPFPPPKSPHRDLGRQRFGVRGSCPSAPPPRQRGSRWDGVGHRHRTEGRECFPQVLLRSRQRTGPADSLSDIEQACQCRRL